MIISLEHARTIYEEIIKKVKKANGKLVIFLGFDIDSLCSLRILITLLRADNVRYEIIPVLNNNKFDYKLEEFRKGYTDINSEVGREIKAFVMINCVGKKDLSEYWFCDETHDINCLIIDVHRPTHHNNIHSKKSILIINDNYYDIENCPRDDDLLALQEDEEIDEENNYVTEEEDSNENDDEESKVPKRRLIKKKENLDTINEESPCDENCDLNEDDVDKLIDKVIAKKSSKSALEDLRRTKRMLRKKKTDMIKNYYSGNYYGLPAAYILYKIAAQLSREDNQILWQLIISTTEHYLQSRLNQSQYEKLYKECHSEVLRLNQNKNTSNPSSIIRKIKKEAEENEQANKGNDPDKEKDKHDFSDVRVKSNNKDVKTILLEPDYRLCLYRHWNLFESFVNSNYTLGHLITWKEPGKDEIKKLLTYIGIPLDEARQKYSYMKNENKTIFKEKIIEVSNRYGLKDFVFYSFVYQMDQKTQLSASDFVYCLSALLEYPFNLKLVDGKECYFQDLDDEETDISNNNDGSNLKDSADEKFLDEEKKMRMQYKYENFWACHDFLSFNNIYKVKTIVNLAIKFQTILISNGTQIVDKKLVQSSKNFRYAIINTDVEEQKYFHNAISLEKLALFVMETHFLTRNNKNMTLKPFVLAILNNTNKTYHVAGVLGNARYLEGDKNQFAMRFKICASKIGATLMLNNFDDCIIEIPKDDFYPFLEEICSD